jgi:hypothetical protein
MSDLLSSASGVIGGLPKLLGGLPNLSALSAVIRPASFRGAGFVVEIAGGEGGRRLVTHQFPLRDKPYTEDLGREAQRHRIRAFVIGDDYQTQRDALLAACQDFDTAGLLVHPYLGERQCRAGVLRWSESKELGGYCVFDLEFVEDGKQASPLSVTDTAGGLLSRLLKLLPIIKRAYAIVSLSAKHPGFLLGFAENLVGQVVGNVLGLPPGTIEGLRSTITGLTSVHDADLPDAVQTVFGGAAQNVSVALAPPPLLDDPVTGTAPTLRPGTDISGGLVALTVWGSDLPAIPSTTPILADMAMQQAAIVRLIRDAATVAVLQVYASVDWPSANAAAAALAKVLELIDARCVAAADAGLDDLYRGWQAVGAIAVRDLTERAQQLPRLATYTMPGSLSSLVLAQQLYGGASRADELVALNDVPHPAFMPRSGLQLIP